MVDVSVAVVVAAVADRVRRGARAPASAPHPDLLSGRGARLKTPAAPGDAGVRGIARVAMLPLTAATGAALVDHPVAVVVEAVAADLAGHCGGPVEGIGAAVSNARDARFVNAAAARGHTPADRCAVRHPAVPPTDCH